MRTFEAGKRYGEHAVVFEIVKRTAKTSTGGAMDSAAATEAAGCGFKSRPVHYWESNYKFIPDTRRNTT